jgi:hypothetical protein
MTIGVVQRRSSDAQEQPMLNQHLGHRFRNVSIWSAQTDGCLGAGCCEWLQRA